MSTYGSVSPQCLQASHCWHTMRGPLWIVLKDGFIVQQCCRCEATRQVHRDHVAAGKGHG